MMTNDDLEKKIAEIIDSSVDDWATRDRRGRIQVHVSTIADILVKSGLKFDTVVSHTATFDTMQQDRINELEKRIAEAEHRAEVAERALDRACEKVFLLSDNCRYSNLKDDVRDSIKLRRSDVENFIAAVREKFLQQAEQELAKEEKDNGKS